MSSSRHFLAPTIPDLAALGAVDREALLGTGAPLEGQERAERTGGTRGAERWRYPLPGTPDASGRPTGRPRGAGTGWLVLRRYVQPPLIECLRGRLRAPRSESLAGRDWNLLCHLRAEGVNTPEPLVLVEEASAFCARRSALVTRELEDCLPLPEWFARPELDPLQRRQALRALGLALRRVLQARVLLPELRLADLFLSVPDPSESELGGGACSLEQIVHAKAGPRAPTLSEGLRWQRSPDAIVTSVRGGRLLPAVDARAAAKWLAGLARAARACGLSERELLRVAWLVAPREREWGRELRIAWRLSPRSRPDAALATAG